MTARQTPASALVRAGLAIGVATLTIALAAPAAAAPSKAECIAASEQAHKLYNGRRLIAARKELLVALDAACPTPIRDDGEQLLGEIDKAAASIVFEAKDAAGNDVSAVRVTVDGAPFAERLDGIAQPVDPGEHTFVFAAPGAPNVEKKLVIREGEKERREGIVMGEARATGAGAASNDGSASRWPARRIAGIAIGAAGVVAIAVGSAFGAIAIKDKSASDAECKSNPDGKCTQAGVNLADAGLSASYASTGLVIGGAALAVTGLVLAVIPVSPGPAGKPSAARAAGEPRVSLALAPGLGGLWLRGAW